MDIKGSRVAAVLVSRIVKERGCQGRGGWDRGQMCGVMTVGLVRSKAATERLGCFGVSVGG